MWNIIIRSNTEASDVKISSSNFSDFENQIFDFVQIIKNRTSSHFVNDPYLLNRLVNCTKALHPTKPGYCSRIFDSWSCFPATQPNSFQEQPCPDFPVLKYARQKFSHKLCDETGSWWVHPYSNKTWSNYTNCVDYQDLSFRNNINTLTIVGLITSLICLLLSLFILSAIHSLACGRVTMHKNLILSLVLSNFSWLLWYYFVLLFPPILLFVD